MITLGKYRITRADQRNLQVEYFRQVKNVKTQEMQESWGFYGFYQSVPQALNVIARLTEMDILEVSRDLEDFRARLAKYADEVTGGPPD